MATLRATIGTTRSMASAPYRRTLSLILGSTKMENTGATEDISTRKTGFMRASGRTAGSTATGSRSPLAPTYTSGSTSRTGKRGSGL